MAATKPDVIVPSNQFISVNATANPPVAVGDAFTIQCKGTSWVTLYEGSSAPAASVTDGVLITNLSYHESTKFIPAGSLEIFAICTNEGRTSKLSVQEG
tara:strand:+ start:3947 stop:4243 length:297 start_codon:yes stop_codon:yes gene_type:complete